ncbi:MAG: Flp pilus assembly complex ATPase component TadA [Proteobacteria bacterium]|nr:Flp pilus assembly complex ATPase component TadA [Pseudomonadota bacterium]MBU1585656.1 Flp pilus assembly complex ATPase component TadA [Pseudomonadota bacterium]MBU2456024.1 Flp pilus assembly complex ATPase component TadA [Pseudomonadota bacterium]
MDEPRKKPLGMLLQEKGIINEAHIQFALKEQKITKEMLGEVLERLSFATEMDIVSVLSQQENIPYVDVDELLPEEKLLKLFNKKLCLNNIFLPYNVDEKYVDIAVSNLNDPKIGQLVNRNTGLTPRFYIAEKSKIINAINKFFYFLENPVEQAIESEIRLLSHDSEMARSMDNLTRHILHLAIKMRATDIHLRPMEQTLNIGFRIDGVMQSVLAFPSSIGRLVSTLKMKADMDIAEQRIPQDGRFSESVLSNRYEFRASTEVSPYGENMVLRVLPVGRSFMGLKELGFFDEDIERVKKMFNEPFGIILLTGPTGSGKSTTLYAGIRCLNLLEKNVLTVEDPIEVNMSLLRQTQVNEKAGYTFSNAIRHFLRHDPDVILVGEIRDPETAGTAISASSTGHLVLSTLHTNSAIGAIPRLRDLGIKPYMISDSLIGVVSQRLIRRICRTCKEEYTPEQWELEYLKDPTIDRLYRGKGCNLCNNSGYFGRTLVYEFLAIDSELSLMIEAENGLNDITAKAKDKGFKDIFDVTAQKTKMGITSIQEAIRVIGNLKQV